MVVLVVVVVVVVVVVAVVISYPRNRKMQRGQRPRVRGRPPRARSASRSWISYTNTVISLVIGMGPITSKFLFLLLVIGNS